MSELGAQLFLLITGALIVIAYFAFCLMAILWLQAHANRRGNFRLLPPATGKGGTGELLPVRSADAPADQRGEDCA